MTKTETKYKLQIRTAQIINFLIMAWSIINLLVVLMALWEFLWLLFFHKNAQGFFFYLAIWVEIGGFIPLFILRGVSIIFIFTQGVRYKYEQQEWINMSGLLSSVALGTSMLTPVIVPDIISVVNYFISRKMLFK